MYELKKAIEAVVHPSYPIGATGANELRWADAIDHLQKVFDGMKDHL